MMMPGSQMTFLLDLRIDIFSENWNLDLILFYFIGIVYLQHNP